MPGICHPPSVFPWQSGTLELEGRNYKFACFWSFPDFPYISFRSTLSAVFCLTSARLICTSSLNRQTKFNPLQTKRRQLYLKTQSVPRSKHLISVIKTNQFMLHGAHVAVCSQINTKQINTVWAERTVVEC